MNGIVGHETAKNLPFPDTALAVQLPRYNTPISSIFRSLRPEISLYIIGRERMIERPARPQFLAFSPLLSP